MEGRGHGLGDPAGNRLGVGPVLQVLAQHDELVTTQPGEGVSRSQRSAQPPRDGGEQLVTDVVPVPVVDGLETVEVGVQHRRDAVGTPGAGHRLFETFLQQGAVGEAGQRVVQAVVIEPGHGRGGVDSGLGVEQVGGGDVGEDTGSPQFLVAERTGSVAVEVEGAEPLVVQRQRESEHCPHARRSGTG